MFLPALPTLCCRFSMDCSDQGYRKLARHCGKLSKIPAFLNQSEEQSGGFGTFSRLTRTSFPTEAFWASFVEVLWQTQNTLDTLHHLAGLAMFSNREKAGRGGRGEGGLRTFTETVAPLCSTLNMQKTKGGWRDGETMCSASSAFAGTASPNTPTSTPAKQRRSDWTSLPFWRSSFRLFTCSRRGLQIPKGEGGEMESQLTDIRDAVQAASPVFIWGMCNLNDIP